MPTLITPTLSLSPNNSFVMEGNSGTTPVTFTATLSAAATSIITVNFSTASSSATSGTDFTPTSGILTFNPGETSKTFTVPVIGDTVYESDEIFSVALSNPIGAIFDLSGSIIKAYEALFTIKNDDVSTQPILSLSPNNSSVIEGNSGTTPVTFTAKLTTAATSTVTVNFSTASSSATSGTDFTPTSGTLTFNPGETSKTFVVPVIGDTLYESDEIFSVALSNPVGAVFDQSGSIIKAYEALFTIKNDDAANQPTLSLSPNNSFVTEGNSGTTPITFTATLSAAATSIVTVNFSTASSTATSGSDFTPSSGTLTFSPGETTKTFVVSVIGDTIYESDEIFSIALSNPVNAIFDQSGAIIKAYEALFTIKNDDVANVVITDTIPPTIAISSSASTLNATQTANITFTLSETSTNFFASDVTVSGGAISNFSGSGTSYTALFTPTTNSTSSAVISVASSTFSDAAGNANADGADANNRVSISVDSVAPTALVFSPADESSSVAIASNIVVTFSEVISQGTGSIVLKTTAGSTIATYDASSSSNLSISGNTLTINPTVDLVSATGYRIELGAGSIKDLVGNSYAGTSSYNFTTITADTTSISQSNGKVHLLVTPSQWSTGNNSINLIVNYDSSIGHYSNVQLVGGGGSSSSSSVTEVGSAGKASISFSASNGLTSGAIDLIFDEVANFGTFTTLISSLVMNGKSFDASIPNSIVIVDTVSPTIAIGSSTASLNTSQTANITFTLSEASTNFVAGDVTVSGGFISNFTGSGTSYAALFTPTANSTSAAVISVASAAFTDAAGNANADGTDANNRVTMSVIAPTNQPTTGTTLNDSFWTNIGNDTFDGGAGNDIVLYHGNIANYEITKIGSNFIVKDNVGNDGTDFVTNIESLQFLNKSISLTVQAKVTAAPTANVTRLVELYIAFFNRIPDADGLSYWLDQMNTGRSITQIADAFYAAGIQYSSLTGFSAAMSDTDFVKVIYKNVLGRTGNTAPSDMDVNYWVKNITSGIDSHGSLINTILGAAHAYKGDVTWGWVSNLLDNKIAVAELFAIDWGLNYISSNDSIIQGMAIAAAVTPTSTAAAIALIGVSATALHLG